MPSPPPTTNCMRWGWCSPAAREGGAKFLQKALDRKHRAAIIRYAGAKHPAALLSLWEDASSKATSQAPIGPR